MDIISFSEKFYKIEKKTSLVKDSQFHDVNFWDIIRHDIFYHIFLNEENLSDKSKFKAKSSLKKIKDVVHFIKTTKEKPIIIISASRVRSGKYYIDPISDPLFEKYKPTECVVYESFADWEITSKKCSNEPFKVLFRRIYSLLPTSKMEEEIAKKIIKHIQREFEFNIDKRFIIERITQFKADYKYYHLVLKTVKPEKVFVIQNGIMKGLFKAAKDLNIKIYELQHGFIGRTHPAYNYDPECNYQSKFIFPDYFLTFSNYWNKCCTYPPKKNIVGKQIKTPKVDTQEYDITFFSSEFHNNYLIPLAIELITLKPNLKICFKFHPNQKHDEDSLRNMLENYDITVFFDEFDSNVLINYSTYSLIIQSSIGFEVINEGRCLLVYEKLNYQENIDLLQLPHTKTFNTIEGLLKILSSKIPDNLERNMFYSNLDIDQYP